MNQIASPEELAQIQNALKHKQARNTNRSYETGIAQFKLFCYQKRVNPEEATPELIAIWINDLNNKGKKMATIRTRLSAVSGYFSRIGIPSPTRSQMITDLLHGFTRLNFEGNELTHPITMEQLINACETLSKKGDIRSLVEQSMLLMGFFGAFRISELANIKLDHLKTEKDKFTIRIDKSKDLKVGEINVKAFNRKSPESVCPVRALERIMEIRPDGFEYLIPIVYKNGSIHPRRINRKYFTGIIKNLFGEKYSSHSLRVGFVTEARRRKATTLEIQNQTGHKVPNMVDHYTRYIDAFEGNAIDRF